MKRKLLKLALCAFVATLPMGAWADDIEKVSQMTMTWTFDQFVHNDVVLSNPANTAASMYIDGLYLAVQGNSTAGARTYTATRQNVTAITKSSNCTDEDVAASSFTTGNYMGLSTNTVGTVRFNNAPKNGTGYSAFGFRVGYAGTIYALVKGTYRENTTRTVALYDCTSYAEHTAATKLDEVTPTDNTTYYLIKGSARADGIYQIMSTGEGACTVCAIKFVPSEGDAGGKRQVSISLTDGVATWSSVYTCAVPTDCKAYIASAVEDGKIKLTEVTEIPANTGVIIKADDPTTTNVTVKSKVPSAYTLPATNKLMANVASYALPETGRDKTATEFTNYILVKDETLGIVFAPTNGTGKVGQNKAYLHLTSSEVSALTPASARGLTLDFDSETTGIQNYRHGTTSSNRFFNMQGREVAHPNKGMYIIDGKKVIVK